MKINEKDRTKTRYAINLINQGNDQMLLGELKQAKSNFQRTIEISKEIKNEWSEAHGHKDVGMLLTYIGRYDQANKELETALGMFAEQNHEQSQCVSCSYRGRCAMLMDEPKSALKVLQKARQFWEKWSKRMNPVERDLVEILWLSGEAKCHLCNLTDAEEDLNEALSRCRRIRLVEFEADILLEMARLQWQKAGDGGRKAEDGGLTEQVKSLTREAQEIADRCEYRLKQADIHNFLAEMAFAENDMDKALKHAKIAKDRAWCDGPPYRYKKALDEAERMLAKLT